MGENRGGPDAGLRLQRRFERSRLERELWEAVYEELLTGSVKDDQQAEKPDSVRVEVGAA